MEPKNSSIDQLGNYGILYNITYTEIFQYLISSEINKIQKNILNKLYLCETTKDHFASPKKK